MEQLITITLSLYKTFLICEKNKKQTLNVNRNIIFPSAFMAKYILIKKINP